MKYWIVAVIAALGAVWFTACRGSGEVEIEGTLKPYPRVAARLTWNNGHATADGLPPNAKVDIGFLDANGDPMGDPVSVGNGDAVPIPDGAEGVTWQFPTAGGSGLRISPRGYRDARPFDEDQRQIAMFALDPWSDAPTAAFYADLTIADSVDFWSAYQIIRPMVSNPIGVVACPSAVNPWIWIQADSDSNGTRFVWADTEDFVTFDFEWNGTPYADLNTNSIRYTAGNWFALEVYVPRADFNGGPWGSNNSSESVWRTASDVNDNRVNGRVVYN